MAADYTLPTVTEKRIRFFDGQFLIEQDFIDEQRYHLDRQRRHQRQLHVSGICDGLTVSSAAARTVTVAPGTAVDADGRTLALAAATDVTLPAERFDATAGAVVRLAYREQPSDEQKGQGSVDYTRWLERPTVVVLPADAEWDGATPPVELGTITVDNRGTVTVQDGARRYAGVRLPGPAGDPVVLRGRPDGAVTLGPAGGPARLAVSPSGRVGIGTDPAVEPAQALTVNGGLALQNGVIQYGGSTVDATSDLGLYSQYPEQWMRLVTTQAPIRFFTDGGVGTNHRLTVEADGKVGVGVTPQAWLDATGAGNRGGPPSLLLRSGNSSAAFDAVQMAFGYNGGAQYRHQVRSRHNGSEVSGNALDFFVWSPDLKDPDGFASRHVLTLDGGNVGIGATTPSNPDKLDRVLDVSGAASANLTVRSATVEGRVVAADNRFFGSAGAGMIVGTKSSSQLNLATVGVTRVTVGKDGRVGVGPTDPQAWLDVTGTGDKAGAPSLQLRSGNGFDKSDAVQMTFAYSGGTQYRHAIRSRHYSAPGLGNALDFCLWDPATGVDGIPKTPTMTLNSGRVGVGTPDPEKVLTVHAENNHVLLRRPTASDAGTKTFLELRQDLTTADGPEVHPSILFHHASKFWNRIECGSDGFHLRWGPTADDHASLALSDLYVYGRMCFKWNNVWKSIQNPSGNTTSSVNLDPQPVTPSDARLKTAIRPITGALRSVLALTGLRYRWGEAGLEHLTRDVADSVSAGPGATDEEHRRVREEEVARARAALDGDDVGLLAQDVERVVPELVHDGADGYKYLRYGQLTALLVEAVKEQQETIERLTGRVEALRAGRGN